MVTDYPCRIDAEQGHLEVAWWTQSACSSSSFMQSAIERLQQFQFHAEPRRVQVTRWTPQSAMQESSNERLQRFQFHAEPRRVQAALLLGHQLKPAKAASHA
ncbi:hypothetical protein V6N13_029682 [Hibiscus sabdariffa]